MRTYLTTLGVLEGIWFTIALLFCCWGVYVEYQKGKECKWKYTFKYYIDKIFTDSDVITAYFIGAFITFVLSIPATVFVFIFKFGDKLLDKL